MYDMSDKKNSFGFPFSFFDSRLFFTHVLDLNMVLVHSKSYILSLIPKKNMFTFSPYLDLYGLF